MRAVCCIFTAIWMYFWNLILVLLMGTLKEKQTEGGVIRAGQCEQVIQLRLEGSLMRRE